MYHPHSIRRCDQYGKSTANLGRVAEAVHVERLLSIRLLTAQLGLSTSQ